MVHDVVYCWLGMTHMYWQQKDTEMEMPSRAKQHGAREGAYLQNIPSIQCEVVGYPRSTTGLLLCLIDLLSTTPEVLRVNSAE